MYSSSQAYSSWRGHGADIRFLSPQPDSSLHCETTDLGLVHHAVCLVFFTVSCVIQLFCYVTG